MCAEKQIVLVGHSFIPTSIGAIEVANIKVYGAPGARASTFGSNRTLSHLLEWPHNITILFTGDNDVFHGCIPNIAKDTKAVIDLTHDHYHLHVAVVLLEPRNPPINKRFNVSHSHYKRIAASINNEGKY